MTDTELIERIERAYRDAVSNQPYCSVSVKDLCAAAGVTRKAFYRHLDGKAAVLRRIFDRDVAQPCVELCQLLSFERMNKLAPEMERRMFAAVYGDRDFYRDIVRSPKGGEEAFMQTAREVFRDFNLFMLDQYGYSGERWSREYAASYFADAKACYLVNWIQDDFSVPVDELSKLYVKVALPFWFSLA